MTWWHVVCVIGSTRRNIQKIIALSFSSLQHKQPFALIHTAPNCDINTFRLRICVYRSSFCVISRILQAHAGRALRRAFILSESESDSLFTWVLRKFKSLFKMCGVVTRRWTQILTVASTFAKWKCALRGLLTWSKSKSERESEIFLWSLPPILRWIAQHIQIVFEPLSKATLQFTFVFVRCEWPRTVLEGIKCIATS